MKQLAPATSAKAGRPTREQAEARHHALLDAALDQFLSKGFELATIESIAKDVGMTKRTVYARYADKVALFHAAVNLAIERYTVSQEQIAATDTGDLRSTLVAIAWLRVEQVLSTNGLRLQRIINAESYRFPDLFVTSYELSGLPTVRFLAGLLERETSADKLAIAEPAKAANVFMSMVVGGPVRSIVLGQSWDRAEIGDRIRYSIDLFLDGARPR